MPRARLIKYIFLFSLLPIVFVVVITIQIASNDKFSFQNEELLRTDSARLFDTHCRSCHLVGSMGAPRVDLRKQWIDLKNAKSSDGILQTGWEGNYKKVGVKYFGISYEDYNQLVHLYFLGNLEN
jgi:hypothetical protein